MKRLLALSLFTLSVASFAQPASSQTPAPSSRGSVTTVSFEGDVVEGDVLRNEGEQVDALPRATHLQLIRVRDNFHDRVMRSADEI